MTASPQTRRSKLPLPPKMQPQRSGAQDTYELILKTAGELLEETGFEQLTTNHICKAAGISPPALYRYFPNKYSVLKELGDRLMRAQDEVIMAWVDAGGLKGTSFEERLAANIAINREMLAIQQAFPGGIAVGRALRAVPALQDVRQKSRDMVAAYFTRAILQDRPELDATRLGVIMRMLIELGYSATEMVMEEPDRDAEIILEESAHAITVYFDQLT